MKGFALGLIMLLKQRLLSSEKLPVVLQLLDVCAYKCFEEHTYYAHMLQPVTSLVVVVVFIDTGPKSMARYS